MYVQHPVLGHLPVQLVDYVFGQRFLLPVFVQDAGVNGERKYKKAGGNNYYSQQNFHG
jgi:hypothetical protein